MNDAAAADLYERDFYAWTQAQARELRRFAATRPNVPLDLPRLAEEIADLGKDRRHALRSWATRVIEHLLLLEHSWAAEPRREWIRVIVDFRGDIERRMTKSFRRDLRARLPRLYEGARRAVARKLENYDEGERAAGLPEACPYTLEQVIGDWWPGGEAR
jgi:Domain of unknown function DUF29